MRGFQFLTATALAVTGVTMNGQSFERRATIRGGSPDRGKCTIDVVVDGAADVEVRGDAAVLRNLSGRPPEWRRFECTGPLPANPANFRFTGVEGRGRQELIRDPRNGGVAVVRIEDKDNGREGYTFDLTWNGDYPGGGQPVPAYPGGDRGYRDDRGGYRDDDAYHRERDDWFRGPDWRQRFFSRIREDVEHVQSKAFPFGADQYRLNRTRQELDEMQGMLAAGRYDERELNDVIAALSQVVRDNRLSPRDRDTLTDDLNRLREFRARRHEWGIR